MSATAIQNLMQRQSTQLSADACTEAWDALEKSSEGVLTVSMTFKLVKFKDKIISTPGASFAIRTKIEGDEDSEEIEDPDQRNLEIV